MEEELEKLTKERDEYLDGWKRAKAEFSNYKKDELKRLENFLKISNEQLVRDLIPVLDSFDLALESFMAGESKHSDQKAEKGIYLIRSQFEDVLKKYGVERILVQPGVPFDPALHEAVATVETSEPPGSVAEEVEHGYKLGDKVIRAVRVKVAK